MKRLLAYTAMAIGILIGILMLMILGAVVAADNQSERQQYSYFVGYVFGVVIMLASGAAIIFGMFRLLFIGDDQQDDAILDKDGPIDRYLK